MKTPARKPSKPSPKSPTKKPSKKPLPVRIVSDVPSMKMPLQPKKASIEKAEGGYIVSKGYGEKQHVAASLDEAQKTLKKLIG